MQKNSTDTSLSGDETPSAVEVPAKMVILSSNATLFWRIFIPVFGTVFMTGLLMAFWLMDTEVLYMDTATLLMVRGGVAVSWAAWVLFVRKTLWKLRRVDADGQHFYVTDYWTTARYPWEDLDRMEETTRLGRRIVHFYLKGSGRFGSKISFLPGSYFRVWKEENHL